MKYIYLDRESAKRGITLVLLVCDEKKENYEEYFEGTAIEFIGEDVPHFITYEVSTDSIREATEEECKFNKSIAFNGVSDSKGNHRHTVGDTQGCPIRINQCFITEEANPAVVWPGTIWVKLENGAEGVTTLGSQSGRSGLPLPLSNTPRYTHNFSKNTGNHRHGVANHTHLQPAHTHPYTAVLHNAKGCHGQGGSLGAALDRTTGTKGNHNHNVNEIPKNEFNMLNPYRAVNIWRRIV